MSLEFRYKKFLVFWRALGIAYEDCVAGPSSRVLRFQIPIENGTISFSTDIHTGLWITQEDHMPLHLPISTPLVTRRLASIERTPYADMKFQPQ